VAGLFTLNSIERGVLNENVLGGLGAGFVEGVSTSNGSAVGVQGFAGSANGASVSDGSVSGFVGFFGSIDGVVVSDGNVVGFKNKTGFVDGVTVSFGTVAGSKNKTGFVDGVTVSTGFTFGSPALSGFADGVLVSFGSASGSPVTPPAPEPVPDIGNGHAPLFQYEPIRPRKPRKPKTVEQLPFTTHSGGALGRTRATGNTRGNCGYIGKVSGSVTLTGRCIGVRYPSDELVARWVRQKQEHELLIVGLL